MNSFNKFLNKLGTIGTGLILASTGLKFFFFVVDGGEKALMFDAITGKGVGTKVLSEGIHFKIPVFYQPIIFSVRMNPHIIETKTPAKDLQIVNITVRILEKPDEEYLSKLYLSQTLKYAERVLPNITHETIKAVVARYNPDQLITQREKVSLEIRQGLVAKAKEFNIILDDVAIIHIEFSKEYRDAIESKLVSQQLAEKAKFVVMKAEEEKKITIIKAEGESESARILNVSIEKHGRAFLELKRLEAAREIVENLSKAANVTYMPNSGSSGDGSKFLFKI
jgi:prohibitin 1